MTFDVCGKTVIITGANSGIGRETALALSGRGATVVLAVRNESAGIATASSIREIYPDASIEVGPHLDLGSPDSVRAFAKAFRAQKRSLHVLVNNAGANYLSDGVTKAGVPDLVQVNYLGPYMLTRLLEPCLVAAAPSRVINVSSVTHRYGCIGNPASFLSKSNKVVGGQYPATKLGNVLFTYELQRRLGRHGVHSCAADPGSVATNIYANSALFSRQPLKWLIQTFYAPPSDGAAAVIHAACAPSWERPVQQKGQRVSKHWGYQRPAGERCEGNTWFFARGAFALPMVTGFLGPQPGFVGALRTQAWAVRALALSGLDWPIRRLSGGKWLAKTVCVASAPASYDSDLARALWDLSADKAGLPR